MLKTIFVALALISAEPAFAVTDGDVARFVTLSERFNSQLSRSAIEGLNAGQQQVRANCILQRIEERFGTQGVAAVMNLMQVLASGTEFDDPTIVEFNKRFGGPYDKAARNCLKVARGS